MLASGGMSHSHCAQLPRVASSPSLAGMLPPLPTHHHHTYSATPNLRPCHLPTQIEDTTSSYQAAISSLTKQLTEAREVASNNELKAQQRKLVLLQVGPDGI